MRAKAAHASRVKKIPCAVIVCAFFFPLSLINAQEFEFNPIRPAIVSARTGGFGGSYSALEAGFDTLSTNPAALAFVKKEWSFARLALQASGPLFDLPAVLQDPDTIVEGVLDLVGNNNGVYIGANMTGPFSFGKVDRNFGFGIFNRTLATIDIPSISSISILSGEELLFLGGYGLTLYEKGSHSLAVGLQMKGFFQFFLVESGTAIGILPSLMSFKVDALPTILSTGFGVDLGVMYRMGNRFSAGITCKDLYTPVFSTLYESSGDFMDGTDSATDFTRLLPDLSLGVTYSIPIPVQWSTVSSWNVMADYRNALDILNPLFRNLILNVAFGTELILLDVVSLRAGISDTYLSAGLGLNLSFFQIDFAMFGKELGIEPGMRPLLNMALSLSFKY